MRLSYLGKLRVPISHRCSFNVQKRGVGLTGMAQLPLLSGGETLLQFHRRRISKYKGRRYRELRGIAHGHLLSRSRKALAPSGENTISGTTLGRLKIPDIWEFASPSSKTQIRDWAKRGRLEGAFCNIFPAPCSLLPALSFYYSLSR